MGNITLNVEKVYDTYLVELFYDGVCFRLADDRDKKKAVDKAKAKLQRLITKLEKV